MVARSTPPLRDISTPGGSDAQDLDADSASTPVEPVRPSEGPRQQLLALAPSPSQIAMIGAGLVAAFLGGAVGYWLGKRQAGRPARPIRKAARTVDSVIELLPVALRLLENPLVRALTMRMLLGKISRRIDH